MHYRNERKYNCIWIFVNIKDYFSWKGCCQYRYWCIESKFSRYWISSFYSTKSINISHDNFNIVDSSSWTKLLSWSSISFHIWTFTLYLDCIFLASANAKKSGNQNMQTSKLKILISFFISDWLQTNATAGTHFCYDNWVS